MTPENYKIAIRDLISSKRLLGVLGVVLFFGILAVIVYVL
jgi:hypothetical protein